MDDAGKMTKDAAIQILKYLLECNYVDSFEDSEKEALDMAIKALEQEPILDKLTEIIEPLKHLAFDEMSDVEWQTLQVIDKYAEQEPCEDCISRQAVLDLIEHYNSDGLGSVFYGYEEGVRFANAVNKLPSVTPTCEEREKESVRGMQDELISRQAVLASIKNLYPDIPVMDIFGARRKWLKKYAPYFECENAIEQLSPVNPTKTGHCKDCKWWRDSDGLYRRGSHAESKCPINRREVFEGNGYCYMFEPQERSDKE